MLGLIKNNILKQKQAIINKKYPSVNINLHPDMPLSSINKMVQLAEIVEKVNSYEPKLSKLSDSALRKKTDEFKEHILKKSELYTPKIKELEEILETTATEEEKDKIRENIKLLRNKIFEEILPEAFAVVRESAKRTIGMRHFDVQIAGGVVLHEGKIAEMATGEGKTLVATLPAYLNALLGKGVHIVTVNDYLAKRDREWMGPVYEFLGLSVGVIQHDMSDEERKKAYLCDITYGTNNEFGFDYLRDNMKYSLEDLVQREFFYAIVDEVDSILIDEARTPLIISGPAEESTEKYYIVDRLVPKLRGRIILEKDEIEAKYKGIDLTKGYDYIVDEKTHAVYLTEEGEEKVASFLGVGSLADFENIEWRHHIIQALRAHNLYKKDRDYVVKEGKVIIVDEFTGRLMPGRRWSDGLHQAIEAKEGLRIERENQTLATITFQNYFRMYEKLAGMTGTAYTEAKEFRDIYRLDVVVLPTNKPLIRKNYPDCIYKTEKAKFNAVVEEIVELYKIGRPVLVGTISIEKSERLSEMLKKRGIPHQVLNAKYHELEAQIVAQAGRLGAVTIATNMAGRGTDILLGGNPQYLARNLIRQKLKPDDPNYEEEYKKLLEKFKQECEIEHKKVVELGGLHIIGTERHEARRIDNQLRGRSGRQGDPGSSRFYVSLEDDLMRLFGSDRLIGIMDKLGLEDSERIEHPWITKSIEIAQRRVEQHNFEIRKQLLEYDNVMNKQREVIYRKRRKILEGASLKEEILGIIERMLQDLINIYVKDTPESDLEGLAQALSLKFGVTIESIQINKDSAYDLRAKLFELLEKIYNEKESLIGQALMRNLERIVFLQVIDEKWKEHLYEMDYIREGIGLRAYGQIDPLVEYRKEAFESFRDMLLQIEERVIETLFRIRPPQIAGLRKVFSLDASKVYHPELESFKSLSSQPSESTVEVSSVSKAYPKVGRNQPCPCGSGKKYKKCHGR